MRGLYQAIFFGIYLSSFALAESAPPFLVVLDPGHGGSDHGAIHLGKNIRITEKAITLALAQEIARQIEARGPQYKVILTRTDDSDVPLQQRTKIANLNKADLFLSIHMNSTQTPMVSAAHGIETYILNNTTDAPSRRLAYLENKVAVSGPPPALAKANHATGGASAGSASDLALIVREFQLDANQSESKHFACLIQGNLTRGLSGQKSRGVKQALFYVLLGADMPSALLEAGFISSPRDRRNVLSLSGRRSIALGVAQAVEGYAKAKGTQSALGTLSKCAMAESKNLASHSH